MDNYAIIPPFLATELLDEEDLTASNILLKMVAKVNELIKNPTPIEVGDGQDGESTDDSVEVVTPALQDDRLVLGPDDPEPVVFDPATEPTAPAHPLEQSFQRNFDFLF